MRTARIGVEFVPGSTAPIEGALAGAMGRFGLGWGRAGGFPAAFATVLKFGLAYKAIDLPLKGLGMTIDGISASLVAGAKSWADYEENMARASRTMRFPGMERGVLKEVMGRDALMFLKDYRVTLQDVATAQYELGSANFDAAQTLQAYQVPLKVAIALQGDITQTTRLMTQMLKIHGEQMGDNMSIQEKMIRLGGILYKTWEIEQVELSDLAAAYKYVAGSAAALRIPAEQLIPLLGYLSTYGLRGSIGGTGVNQFFTQLARNIEITDGQITKLKKSVRGMEHEITMKPGTTTVLDLLIQTSQAMQKLGQDPTARLQIANILSGMFNIRGARPALLLADTERLAKLLETIGNVANASTAELEAMYEEGVRIMQLTPGGQWDIFKNKLYAIGVEFTRAVVGGDDFIDTMVRLNEKLDRFIDRASTAGEVTRTFLAQLVGAWSKIGEMPGWAVPLFLTPPGMAYMGVKGIAGAREAAGAMRTEIGAEQIRTQVLEVIRQGMKAGKTPQQIRSEAERALLYGQQIAALKGPGYEYAARGIKLEDLIRQEEERAAAQAMGRPLGAGPPEYKGVPSGRAGRPGRTPEELADEAAREFMQFLESKRTLYEYSRFMRARGRPAPEAPRFPWEWQVSNLQQIVEGRGAYALTSREARARAAEAQRRIIEQEEQRREGFALGYRRSELEVQYERLTDTRKEAEKVVNALTRREQVFGETMFTVSSRIEAYQAVLMSLQDERKVALAAYEEERRRYEGHKVTLEALMSDQERNMDEIEHTKEKMDEAKGAADAWKGGLEGLDRSIADLSQQTIPQLNRQLGTMGLLGDLERLGSFTDIARARFEALGGEWETSSQALEALNAEIELQDKLWSAALAKGDEAALRQAYQAGQVGRARRDALMRQREDLLYDWNLRIRGARRGWFRGTPQEMARMQIAGALEELEAEMRDLRRRHPWAEAMLTDYEQTMKTDRILRPWLDARDRIETEWTNAFVNIFAQAQEGTVDLMDAFRSIIGSIQAQIISAWVRRHMGGLFEQLASAEVGYTPEQFGVSTSARMAATSLDSLSLQVGLTTTNFRALNAQLAAGAAGGGGAGGVGGWAFGMGAPILTVQAARQSKEIVAAGVYAAVDKKDKETKAKAGGKPAAGTFAGAMQNYAVASMIAGPVGSMLGYDPGSAAVAGGLGYAAGMAVGLGPVGAIALGLGAIFGFGKRKPKPAAGEGPRRDIYGMPAFEYESYLYNLYENQKGLSAYDLGSTSRWRLSERTMAGAPIVVANSSIGQVIVNVNGGDLASVYRTVKDAINGELIGPMARARATAGEVRNV